LYRKNVAFSAGNNTFDVFQQKSGSSSSSQPAPEASAKGPNQQPQTLEELLERQWEQGSQFLMEQASHFDSKLLN
jgi:hypothetical protein